MNKPDWKDAPRVLLRDPVSGRILPTGRRNCRVDNCSCLSVAKGFCDTHYRRWKKHGDPLCVKVEKHGYRRSVEYRIWSHIKGRCCNPNDTNYADYGGRGIKICKKWRHSFLAFLRDMGKRPNGMQIDRIDNNGNYCKKNCRWTTPAKNNQNRRSTKLSPSDVITIRASSDIGEVLAERYGISISQALRVKNGKRWKDV
jgi:hypothetical protein